MTSGSVQDLQAKFPLWEARLCLWEANPFADSERSRKNRRKDSPPTSRLAYVVAIFISLTSFTRAEPPRALSPGEKPKDARLGELKTLHGYFPFAVPKSAEAWNERREQLRRQLLVGLGLWPMPTKTPANAVVHGKVEREEYTVERVYLESFPGHFVTGSLYRPKNVEGPRPLVLCPYGHWPNGRFHALSDDELKKQLASGAERFEIGGRYPLQARCVQLARMGCIVFHYDMVGQADSRQLVHRPGVREHMNTSENWGFFSPQAELRLQHICGLQTYNSIRALDWLCELPDVDKSRIGVTGASGGGTQTFLLAAVDPRVRVSVPAVMVSTAMQGGCPCENCSYLRVDTGNVEIAGLFAPKPLGMIGADDWTIELMTKGYPELKQLYTLLGSPDNVAAWVHPEFKHNYNAVSRGDMYGFMNKHLKLGLAEPIVERDFMPLSIEELTVWDDEHPAPPSGDDYERSLLRWMTEDSEQQLAALVPKDGESAEKWRSVMAPAIEALIGRGLPQPEDVTFEKTSETDRGEYVETIGLMTNRVHSEQNPVILRRPKEWNYHIIIWADEQGKGGADLRSFEKFLRRGTAVATIDLFGQGEFTDDGKSWEKQRLVNGGDKDLWQKYAAFTFGYNDSLFVQRVHDLMSLVTLVRHQDSSPVHVHMIGHGRASLWVAATRAQAGAVIETAIVDTEGLRFSELDEFADVRFWPGIVKYGDLPALLALSAPHPLFVTGENLKLPEAIYRATGQEQNLRSTSGWIDIPQGR